ncbi:signal peptidase I [Kitasatospora sp. NPDC058218]|uniref:signal peptidase I n=1 Tax=Kitasatospora sp. NPDC058218 TaxID=3346385 RepID=UPI0036DE84CC
MMTGPKRWPLWTSVGVAAAGLLAAAFGMALVAFGYSVHQTPSQAMNPTLERGTSIITEKVRGDEVRRGDVVLVADPWDLRGMVVKRVIGIGGDRVACCPQGGGVTLNGQPLSEPYLHEGSPNGGLPEYSAVVPAGRLFLLGDHRTDSLDSRMYQAADQGSVAASAVRERVVWHGGTDPEPLPGKLLGALAAIVGGGLLLVVGTIGAIVAAVIGARRRSRMPITV